MTVATPTSATPVPSHTPRGVDTRSTTLDSAPTNSGVTQKSSAPCVAGAYFSPVM
jgi:hypothetical protein